MKRVVRKLPDWALPICVNWEKLWLDSPYLNLSGPGMGESSSFLNAFLSLDIWEEIFDDNGQIIGYKGLLFLFLHFNIVFNHNLIIIGGA